MNKSLIVVGGAAVAVAGAGLWLQHADNQELRREIALLRADVQAHGSPAGPGGMSPGPGATAPVAGAAGSEKSAALDKAELAKLREDVAALRKSAQEITQFTQLAQAANALKGMQGTENTIATKLVPLEAMKNAGKATPEATTETVLWAAAGGDVDTLSNSFVFTPTAREKADAWFAGLPDDLKRQYESADKVIALMIAKDAAALTGMQVLGQKEIGTDLVGVRIRFAAGEGKTKDDNLVMRRTADGWRMLVPDQAVEKFARQLSGGK